jgi:hypothetical protein
MRVIDSEDIQAALVHVAVSGEHALGLRPIFLGTGRGVDQRIALHNPANSQTFWCLFDKPRQQSAALVGHLGDGLRRHFFMDFTRQSQTKWG